MVKSTRAFFSLGAERYSASLTARPTRDFGNLFAFPRRIL